VIGEQTKSANDYSSAQKTSSGHEVFCVRYSPDGQFVAAARGNGNIDVFSATKGTKVYELPSADQTGASPTCCIRFRPNTASSKTRNVLLAVDAAGMVSGQDKYDPPRVCAGGLSYGGL
jgi:WD40 repeat protein